MTEPQRGEDEWLASALPLFGEGPGTVLGPGHDAAAVRFPGDGIAVVAKDVVVDGVHFHLEECGPALAARKALAVNLSDLAAAAATPAGFLVGAVLPHPASRDLFDALMAGFAAASEELECPCLGGDTNVAEGPLVLSVTVLGRPGAAGVISRAGAQAGDRLSVTGALGGSAGGRHLTFTPRVREAAALARAGVPHAMIDLSDGLSRDLPRLARASRVGARLVAARIPVHADVGEAPDPLAHALGDGEDFELLVAHAALDPQELATLGEAGVSLFDIGEVVAEAEGITIEGEGGTAALEAGGFDHIDR